MPQRSGRAGGTGGGATAALLLVFCLATTALAQGTALEAAIKATYLYKFAPFVDWPPAPAQRATFDICVLGDDPFGSMLDSAVGGQVLDGRPFVVRRLATGAADSACHIAYVSGSASQPAQQMLALLRGRPVLTVTDASRTGSVRGIVHFIIQDNRVRFEIDDGLAAEAGLRISSRLLSLATAVRQRG